MPDLLRNRKVGFGTLALQIATELGTGFHNILKTKTHLNSAASFGSQWPHGRGGSSPLLGTT